MLVTEEYLNRTENYMIGDSGPYEPYTDNLKELFNTYQRQFGRCISKVYIDIQNQAKAIGWVFQKLEKYEDTHEPYLMETWVTLHNNKPVKTIECDYHFIK
jgi:hypothetical protein